jgi:glycerol uptake facilitator-like aquaporin
MKLTKRLSAEAIGSLFLAAAVVGSGIMAERLAGGNAAVALLANTGATVAVLATLIALLGPISGAHFNPAVSLIQAARGVLAWGDAGAYALVQVLGCCLGAILAHAMFDLPWLQSSAHVRTGTSQWLAEAVATFGLLLVILGHRRTEDAPWMVAAWIGGAYWFTASTSFANPAITIARSLSDTFSGIRPADVPAFIVAQLAGALLALLVARSLFSVDRARAVAIPAQALADTPRTEESHGESSAESAMPQVSGTHALPATPRKVRSSSI